MSALSRRSLVATAVALPALAVPALASPAPDPIFGAIERYKTADVEHGKACKAEPPFDSPDYEAWDEAASIACHRAADAARDFCKTAPTTLAGIVVAIRFTLQTAEERPGEGILRFLTETSGTETCHGTFLRSIASAAELLAVRGV